MGQSLAEYVAGLLSQGYHEQQVREFLLQNGYPQSMIDSAFRELSGVQNAGFSQPTTAQSAASSSSAGFSTPSSEYSTQGSASNQSAAFGTQSSPAVAALVAYLRTYLAQGYQVEQLRPYLVQQGYAASDVDAAIAQVTGAPVIKHEVHLPTGTILKIAFVLLVIAGIVFGLSFLKGMGGGNGGGGGNIGSGQSRLLDVVLELDAASVAPGEDVQATVTLTNKGGAGTYDAEVEFRLNDEYGDEMWSEKVTRAISTSMDVSKRVPVDDDLDDGQYEVEVVAWYSGEAPATATARFTVKTPSSGTPASSADGDDDARGYNPPIIIIKDGGGEDVTKRALALAEKGDSSRAEQECLAEKNLARRDQCLNAIVMADHNPGHCAKVSDAEDRDTCLMPFILEGQYSLCDKLESPDRQKLCDNLKHLQQLESTMSQAPSGGSSGSGDDQPPPDINDFSTPSG